MAISRPPTEISRHGRAIMTTAPTAAAMPRYCNGLLSAKAESAGVANSRPICAG